MAGLREETYGQCVEGALINDLNRASENGAGSLTSLRIVIAVGLLLTFDLAGNSILGVHREPPI